MIVNIVYCIHYCSRMESGTWTTIFSLMIITITKDSQIAFVTIYSFCLTYAIHQKLWFNACTLTASNIFVDVFAFLLLCLALPVPLRLVLGVLAPLLIRSISPPLVSETSCRLEAETADLSDVVETVRARPSLPLVSPGSAPLL